MAAHLRLVEITPAPWSVRLSAIKGCAYAESYWRRAGIKHLEEHFRDTKRRFIMQLLMALILSGDPVKIAALDVWRELRDKGWLA